MPQATTSSAPAASASWRNRRTTATAASAASSGMRPWRPTRSPSRSISFSVMIGSNPPSARTSATIRWNEFDPRSNAATRTRRRLPTPPRRILRPACDGDGPITAFRGQADPGVVPMHSDVTKVLSRDRVEARFGAMGREARVVVLSGPPRLDERARHLIEVLERKWSRFRSGSEISRLNATNGRAVVVSPETFGLVERAIASWRVTGGRYDPSVAGQRVVEHGSGLRVEPGLFACRARRATAVGSRARRRAPRPRRDRLRLRNRPRGRRPAPRWRDRRRS